MRERADVTGADTGDMLTLAYGLSAATFLAVVVVAILRHRRQPATRVAAVATAAGVIALWSALVAWGTPSPGLVGLLDVVRAVAVLTALVAVGGLWRGPPLRLLGLGLVMALAAVAAVQALAVLAPHPPGGAPPPAAPTVLLVLSVTGLALVETILRTHDAEARWAVKHLCLGFGVMLAYDVFLFAEALLFGGLDPQLGVARAFVAALCAGPITVTLFRKPVGRRRIRPSRDILLKSSVFLAAGLYLVVMALAGYWIREVGGRWGPVTQAVFLVGSLLLLGVLFLSGSAWARLRVWFAKNFFSHRYDYRHEWLRFTRTVAGDDDAGAETLHMRIVRATCDIVDGTAGGLWVHQERDRAFIPSALWNLPETLPALDDGAPLPGFLRRKHWVVDLEELRSHPDRYGFAPPEWLTACDGWLVLPLVVHGSVVGMLVVAAPRVRRRLTWEDFDILKTVGRHAAATLATEKALNELSDARRLEAFSKRTAFLVHDVKNVVSQLDLMLKNAERVGHDPDFQKDLLETTAGAVKKLHGLLAELRGARAPDAPPPRPDAAVVPGAPDLAAQVAEAVVRWRRRAPALRLRAEAEGLTLPAPEPESFRRVLDHLVQNALEAAGADAPVEVSLAAVPAEEGGGVAVAVRDDGAGMDPAFIRRRLFRPLDTSKADGYGLGAFQAREIAREIGGRLDVRSRPGEGTTMRIVFPAAAPAGAPPAFPATTEAV